MRKTLALSLALLLVLPIIVSADNNRGNVNEDENDQGGRLVQKLIKNNPLLTATGTETWQIKTKAYRDQLKNDRDKNLLEGSSTASTTDQEGDDKNLTGRKNRNERIQLYADYLLQRLERQINNVANLIIRVKARTEIMAGNGKDVTTIKAKITQADTALGGAKDQIKLLPSEFEAVGSSTASSSGPIQTLKTSAQSVVDAIKSAHDLIVEAITMINQGQ
jgi:hypothetical protein